MVVPTHTPPVSFNNFRLIAIFELETSMLNDNGVVSIKYEELEAKEKSLLEESSFVSFGFGILFLII